MFGGSLVFGEPEKLQTRFLKLLNCRLTRQQLLKDTTLIQNDNIPDGTFFSIYYDLPFGTIKIDYQLGQLISEGSFGWIYELNRIRLPGASPIGVVNPEIPNSLAIKIPKHPQDLERDLTILAILEQSHSNSLNLFIDTCQLQIPWNAQQTLPVLLMEKMDGVLSDLKFDSQTSIYDKYAIYYNILIQILEGYIILYDNGYYYTDTKAENVLYRVIAPGILEVFISDFGGTSVSDDQSFSLTYPYIYRSFDKQGRKLQYSPHVIDFIYGVMIIFIQMHIDYFDPRLLENLYYKNMTSNQSQNVKQSTDTINLIFRQINTYLNLPIDLRELNKLLQQFIIGKNRFMENQTQVLQAFQELLDSIYQYLLTTSKFAREQLYLPVKLLENSELISEMQRERAHINSILQQKNRIRATYPNQSISHDQSISELDTSAEQTDISAITDTKDAQRTQASNNFGRQPVNELKQLAVDSTGSVIVIG